MISTDFLLTHEEGSLFHNGDWVIGVIFVPLGDQFIAGFADVLAVENGAAKDALLS
jgi:hypothetical protein